MLVNKLKIECRCLPNNPFYLRWINRYGGWDYWMFEKRQTYEYNQSDLQQYTPYIDDFSSSTVSGTAKLVSKEVEETVLVGSENLTAKEWRIVADIVKSSVVQWYNKDIERWIDVMLTKQKIVMQSDSTYNGLELTLTLPTPQLAI